MGGLENRRVRGQARQQGVISGHGADAREGRGQGIPQEFLRAQSGSANRLKHTLCYQAIRAKIFLEDAMQNSKNEVFTVGGKTVEERMIGGTSYFLGHWSGGTLVATYAGAVLALHGPDFGGTDRDLLRWAQHKVRAGQLHRVGLSETDTPA